MINEPKATVVGFDLSGNRFPEDARQFLPGFLLERLKGRFVNQKLTPGLVRGVEAEVYSLLATAKDVYRLDICDQTADFWAVECYQDEIARTVTLSVVPQVLKNCELHFDVKPDRVTVTVRWSPRADEMELFVVAPSTIEALIGLAHLIKRRRRD